MSFEVTAILLSWIAIVMLAFALSGVIRQVRVLTASQSVPQRGRRVGPPDGLDLTEVLPDLQMANEETVLLFADADCAVCDQLVEGLDLASTRNGNPNGDPIVHVLYKGAIPPGKTSGPRVHGELSEVFDRLKIPVTPFGVKVTGGKVSAAAPIGSLEQMEQILAEEEKRG